MYVDVGGYELLYKVFNIEITQSVKDFLGQALREPSMMMCACNASLGGGGRRIPGACWLVSLAESVSSRPSETSCTKKKYAERQLKDTIPPPPPHIHTHTQNKKKNEFPFSLQRFL